jgi:hypothetical protein
MSELPIALSASTIDTLFSFPRKLPEQHWSIPSLLEEPPVPIPPLLGEPPVPTRKRPALMTESQIRKLTSAPTREPTALVDHRKIANLKINHIESIDRLQESPKRFLKVNHKEVPMGIPPVLFIEILAVNITGVPQELPTVPSGAKLEPPDPAPTEAALTRELTSAEPPDPAPTGAALTRELTSAPTSKPPGNPSAPAREPTSAPKMKPLAPPSTKKVLPTPTQEPLTLISTNIQSKWNTALTPTKEQLSPTRKPLAPTIQPSDPCQNKTAALLPEPQFHFTNQLPPVPMRELLLLHSTRELPSFVPMRELLLLHSTRELPSFPTAPTMEHPLSSAQALSLGPPRETPQLVVSPPVSHCILLAPTPSLQCPLPVELVWPTAIFPTIKAEPSLTMSSGSGQQKTLNRDPSLILCPGLQLTNSPSPVRLPQYYHPSPFYGNSYDYLDQLKVHQYHSHPSLSVHVKL